MSYTLKYTGSQIDDILDRAVEGGAIDDEIATKQDALTFDAVPTEGSTNPAESGGIYDAIQAGGATALAAFATDSVSGDVVSFPDGADGVPVKSLVANIDPVQDLNGYDNPWPAGGGKNKLPYPYVSKTKTTNGITFTDKGDGTIAINGTATGNADFTLVNSLQLPSGNYTFSIENIPNGAYVAKSAGGGTAYANIYSYSFPYTLEITDNSAIEYIILRITSGITVSNVTVKPMIRLASVSDATFAPYSNICPISGWTGAEIYRIKMEQGSYSTGEGYIDTPIRIMSNGWIRQTGGAITVTLSSSSYEWLVFNADSADGANAASIGGWSDSGATGTVLKQYIKILVRNKTTPSADITPSEVVVKIEGIDPTVAIAFSSTVYAGTITALGGGLWKIQPTQKYVDLNSLTWVYVSGRFRASVTDIANIATRALPMLCSDYQVISDGRALANVPDYSIYNGGGTPTYLFVHDSRYADAPTFNANVTGTVLYPLATLPDPIIVTAEDLSTLLGVNNIWADTGDVSVEYRADTKKYIDAQIAAVMAIVSE